MNDERYEILYNRVDSLTTEQICRIINYPNQMVMDDCNYDEKNKTFCPLAVALDIPKIINNPTNDLVRNEIIKIASKQIDNFEINPTKGVKGEFYTINRQEDLLNLCKKVLLERVENKIICADVIEGLKKIPDNIISLIFTSPPYNAQQDYGDNCDDNKPYQVYLDWLKSIWIECKRVLRPGGRLVVNIDSITTRGKDKGRAYIRPIFADLELQMREIDMKFYMEICWYKQNAPGSGTSWGSWLNCSLPVCKKNHEYVFVWSKDQFKLEGDSELSDMTPEEFAKYTLSVWHILPETKKIGNHPCPMPEELAKRVIKLFSYRNDIVLDPFVGVGTITSVAARLGRRWIGIDNNQEYIDFATKRTNYEASAIQIDYVPRSERLKRYKENKVEKEGNNSEFNEMI